MKRVVNYKMGAQKRKYNLGKGEVEPGTFIRKSQLVSKKTITKELPKEVKLRTVIMGAI